MSKIATLIRFTFGKEDIIHFIYKFHYFSPENNRNLVTESKIYTLAAKRFEIFLETII